MIRIKSWEFVRRAWFMSALRAWLVAIALWVGLSVLPPALRAANNDDSALIEARQRVEELLARKARDPGSVPDLLLTPAYINLGWAAQRFAQTSNDAGFYAESAKAFEHALAADGFPSKELRIKTKAALADSTRGWANATKDPARYDRAITLYREIGASLRAQESPADPETLAENRIGLALALRGRSEIGEELAGYKRESRDAMRDAFELIASAEKPCATFRCREVRAVIVPILPYWEINDGVDAGDADLIRMGISRFNCESGCAADSLFLIAWGRKNIGRLEKSMIELKAADGILAELEGLGPRSRGDRLFERANIAYLEYTLEGDADRLEIAIDRIDQALDIFRSAGEDERARYAAEDKAHYLIERHRLLGSAEDKQALPNSSDAQEPEGVCDELADQGSVQDILDKYQTELIEACAEGGNAQAQVSLGFGYAAGKKLQRDFSRARVWLEKATQQKVPLAQFMLGSMYFLGTGVTKDLDEAIRLYRLAADQKYADAQFALGEMYDQGLGLAANSAEAINLFELAANQGQPHAQFRLAQKFERGEGKPQDFAQAARWYRAAADQGHAMAMTELGGIYQMGHLGEPDYAAALKWYRMAAEKGEIHAQLALGSMYTGGDGVPVDYIEAMKWFIIFEADSGLEAGAKDAVANQLSEEDFALAERRAQDWLAQHPRPQD